MTDKILHDVYYNPENEASFGSAEKLYNAVKIHNISMSVVKDWLSKQITYTLHKSRRRHFKRNPIVVTDMYKQWQADLVDMSAFSKANNGFRYLITIIDVFSKYGYAFAVHKKTGAEVKAGFRKIFSTHKPESLQTDMGGEFKNTGLKALLKTENITYFTAKNTETKCAIVERFNKTLRNRMFRYFTSKGTRKYIDVLPKLLTAYNNSVNRSIGLAPSKVTHEHRDQIFEKLYGVKTERDLLRKQTIKPKLKLKDNVRIPYLAEPLDKGYYPTWTDEIFTVEQANKDNKKPQYKIKDASGEEIEGRFYPEELQKIGERIWRVERVIRKRTINGTRQCFVKWLNFSDTQNSWINESDLSSVS